MQVTDQKDLNLYKKKEKKKNVYSAEEYRFSCIGFVYMCRWTVGKPQLHCIVFSNIIEMLNSFPPKKSNLKDNSLKNPTFYSGGEDATISHHVIKSFLYYLYKIKSVLN